MEQGLGHFFITSSSSDLFDETDLEQYLFKQVNSIANHSCNIDRLTETLRCTSDGVKENGGSLQLDSNSNQRLYKLIFTTFLLDVQQL